MAKPDNNPIRISVVDDHSLFRKGLINLIHQVDSQFEVISEAANGKELLAQLDAGIKPNVIVMDVNMPVMDGHKTTQALRRRDSSPGILALTMLDDEVTLLRLLRAGVNGYLDKDVEPKELKSAIHAIAANGFYYTDYVAGKLVQVVREPAHDAKGLTDLSVQEMQFMELCCSDDPYKVIADKMCLSIKTIDGYRARLFEKLGSKSRVGLVLFALKHKLISLEKYNSH